MFFTDKIVTAKKHYRCDASEQWNCAGYSLAECETGEQQLVEAAEADKWRILPGQAYRKVTGIHDGLSAPTEQGRAWTQCAAPSICGTSESA